MPVVGVGKEKQLSVVFPQTKPMEQGDERGECIETKRGDYETLETERSSTSSEAKQKRKKRFSEYETKKQTR